MCWRQGSATAQHPQPQDNRLVGTDRPGEHGGGAWGPGTWLRAMGPKNQRALCAWRSPGASLTHRSPLPLPKLAWVFLALILGLIDLGFLFVQKCNPSAPGPGDPSLPRCPESHSPPTFTGNGGSLGLGGMATQERWGVKEAGGVCAQLQPPPSCTGRPRGVYLDFLIIIFTFFLLMKKF